MINANQVQSTVRALFILWFFGIFLFAWYLADNSMQVSERLAIIKAAPGDMLNFQKPAKSPSTKLNMLVDPDLLDIQDDQLELLLNDQSDNNVTGTKMIDPRTFKYLLNEPDVCNVKKPDLFLIYVVHTHPRNYKRRMHIRSTWANQG